MQTKSAEPGATGASELRVSEKRLGSLIGLAARQWRRAVDLRLQKFGLTEATWAPLLRLAQASAPMRQKDLAAALSLDSSSVVRILHNLEEAGLIKRREDTEDRRAKAIAITRQGKALVRQVEAVSEDVQREVVGELRPDDIAVTKQILEAICRALIQLNDESQTK
jgi:MarR family transcriptional regulator for hemolysin